MAGHDSLDLHLRASETQSDSKLLYPLRGDMGPAKLAHGLGNSPGRLTVGGFVQHTAHVSPEFIRVNLLLAVRSGNRHHNFAGADRCQPARIIPTITDWKVRGSRHVAPPSASDPSNQAVRGNPCVYSAR